MISLMDKQKIIIDGFLEGKSQWAIHRKTRIDRKTIREYIREYEKGISLTLAITSKEERYLIGTIGLVLNKDYDRGSLGYWIGRPYWNKGYCTEAAKGLCDYGFQNIGLNKIYATHLKRNLSSGKVMQKIGMKQEEIFKEHVKKWGVYEDLVYYGMLKRNIKMN